MRVHHLSDELVKWREIIVKRAQDVGLDFFDVVFEMVDYREINELASLGGFPQRYPHWRFGMEYDRLSKSYAHGMSKIYEMVINTDPCIAYLLSSNSLLEHKLVMAHVYGHADFFKHNVFFGHTNRKMLDVMANHAVKVRRIQEKVGIDVVEEFIDACLSLENLIDYRNLGNHQWTVMGGLEKKENLDQGENDSSLPPVMTSRYVESFVKNDRPSESSDQKNPSNEGADHKRNFPERPERDILKFLLEHAPLEGWQQEVLSIVRQESYYFAPQGQTKIMNEGWASYWHSKLLTEGILNDSEIIDFASVHSGTMAMQPGGLNPYKIGIELFRDIEIRWNKGQFGKDWEECRDIKEKENWNKDLGQGRDKIFSVRKIYNDLTFIDEFLTEDFCRKNKFFTFVQNSRTGQAEIEGREFKKIKEQLLSQLTNFGQPIIEVENANHDNRGELLLNHIFDGREIRLDLAHLTMKNVNRLWNRPVNLLTQTERQKLLLRFDGKDFTHKNL